MATPFNLRVKDQILVFACEKEKAQTTAEIETSPSPSLHDDVCESESRSLFFSALNALRQ